MAVGAFRTSAPPVSSLVRALLNDRVCSLGQILELEVHRPIPEANLESSALCPDGDQLGEPLFGRRCRGQSSLERLCREAAGKGVRLQGANRESAGDRLTDVGCDGVQELFTRVVLDPANIRMSTVRLETSLFPRSGKDETYHLAKRGKR